MTISTVTQNLNQQSESLTIQIQRYEKEPSAVTVYLSGYIDEYNSNILLDKINELIAKNFTQLLFLCGELKHVSFIGLQVFSKILKEVKLLKGELFLINLQPKVYENFQFLGYSQSFSFIQNLEDVNHDYINNLNLSKTNFPRLFTCITCGIELKAIKAGKFRCSNCKTILTIDNNAKTFLES